MGKAIWYHTADKQWYATKKEANKVNPGLELLITRIDCPGHCDPYQLARFLNQIDAKYKVKTE